MNTMPMEAFPSVAPYRIDQVMAAPQAMGLLFMAQAGLAGAMSWAAIRRRYRSWGIVTGLFLLLVAVFFTLASWGNSDTTKLSHFLVFRPIPLPVEPFWTLIAPLVVRLPYRMSLVHGMVAAAYAAAPIVLSRAWGARAWGGWWALFVICNPMLRGFLQNAHSRQALSLLLLLPLLMHGARLLKVDRIWQAVCMLFAAVTHGTFIFNLAFSLTPLLLRLPAGLRLLPQWLMSLRWQDLRRFWPRILIVLLAFLLLSSLAPMAVGRVLRYGNDPYFNTYLLRPVIGRLQWALALGLVLGSLQRCLSPLRLLQCDLTQLLLVFGLLYVGIQVSVSNEWFPQVSSRLADGIGFFQLIIYLAWLHRYRAYWCLLPGLYVTLQYWIEARILASAAFDCGRNDEFLCIPDRWPWLLRY